MRQKLKFKITILYLFIVLFLSCHIKPVITSNEIEKLNVFIPQRFTVNFAAVGDNLFHHSVYGSQLVNGVYDFAPIY